MALILQDICLLLMCLFCAVALECEINSPCLGRRPRVVGCCPLLAGEECDINGKRQCDTSLGYNCTSGFCHGNYIFIYVFFLPTPRRNYYNDTYMCIVYSLFIISVPVFHTYLFIFLSSTFRFPY